MLVDATAQPQLAHATATSARAPLTILHIVAPATVGGLERVVHALASGQTRRGHDVTVLAFDYGTTPDNPFVRELSEAGVDVRRARVPTRGYLEERRATDRACRALRPQIVHTHGMRVDLVSGGVPRRRGIPSVATVHGRTGGDLKMRVYEWAQYASLRWRDAVIAVSQPLIEVLAAHGVARKRVHLIANCWTPSPPPLARDDALAALRVSGLPEDARTVGFVGRLSREKGADVLVEAIAALNDRRVHALIVGDGAERGALERLAAQRGIGDQLHFTGNVHGAGRLTRAFDLFALSSRTEGTPIALFEAMAAGVPVVATRVGGVPDVVSESDALLVPSDNPAALAAAIRESLDDHASAARRAVLARIRLDTAFAAEPWLERHDALYYSLLDGVTASAAVPA